MSNMTWERVRELGEAMFPLLRERGPMTVNALAEAVGCTEYEADRAVFWTRTHGFFTTATHKITPDTLVYAGKVVVLDDPVGDIQAVVRSHTPCKSS